MNSTRAYIKSLLILGLVIFELQSCTQSVPSDCNIILPDFKIVNKFCSSEYQIVFGDLGASNGKWPYAYEWSDGTKNLNNLDIESSGNYQLTVTDANGCSRVNVYDVEDELKVPRLKSANVTEVLCDQATAVIEVEYFLPSYDSDIDIGVEYEYIDPVSNQKQLRSFAIKEQGFGQITLAGIFADQSQPLKLIPFARHKGNKRLKCYGDPIFLDIPIIDLPEEYYDTWIEIKKVDPSNCDTPHGEFFLDGFCGSPEGCYVDGDPPLVNPYVPYGDFEVNLPSVVGIRRYSILPLLENDIQCAELSLFDNNIGAVSVTNQDYNLISMSDHNWTDGENCNCFIFELDDDFNSQVSITQSELSTDGAVVTQTGPNTATVCIENDGPHCVTVVDQYGCETEFCNQLTVRTIETSELSTYVESPFGETGNFLATIGDDTALPVTWDVGQLSKYINSIDGSSIHLSALSKGEYSIEVIDANGCSKIIEFEIENCLLLGFIDEIVAYEGINNPDNERYISVTTRFSPNEVEGFSEIDYILIEEAIKDLSTYSWTGPAGFTSNDKGVFPTKTGIYCLELRTVCGKTFKECYDFIAVVE